jgi:hypothetical protein
VNVALGNAEEFSSCASILFFEESFGILVDFAFCRAETFVDL